MNDVLFIECYECKRPIKSGSVAIEHLFTNLVDSQSVGLFTKKVQTGANYYHPECASAHKIDCEVVDLHYVREL